MAFPGCSQTLPGRPNSLSMLAKGPATLAVSSDLAKLFGFVAKEVGPWGGRTLLGDSYDYEILVLVVSICSSVCC
jgi:hypothetical protein